MTSRAAIIGAGVIGAGWAARFLLMGWDVNVCDPDPDAEHKINQVVANARRSLPGLHDTALPRQGTLRYVTHLADAVSGVNWVQESCPERLDIKLDTLREIQATCPPDSIIASSTSGFRPSQLQEGSCRPDQIIVAHPFNPVYLLPVVELVGVEATVQRASSIVSEIGMKPLHVRNEIDAHIADRLLEAVWREALWLVHDDVATTTEIDDVIRFGFGLRWAQMGLFETYRIAGGEDGMAHFISQFGPALKWPWSKLTDVPDLTDELVRKIASQSDNQSGHYSIRELERIRDDNLVAIMRSLKATDWGVGSALNAIDAMLEPLPGIGEAGGLRTVERAIPRDWADHSGHMNEGRYGAIFSDAAERVLTCIGAGATYVQNGNGFITAEAQTQFLRAVRAGQHVWVESFVRKAAGTQLILQHEIKSDGIDGPLARSNQTLIHVCLTTRQACEPEDTIGRKMIALATAHAGRAAANR